ncbi:hypothetical protein M433DRAFT_70892, partial [Acidomyces richmondensis BFW]
HVLGPHTKEHDSQRASVAGRLLVTDVGFISPRGGGNRITSRSRNDDRIVARKEITDAVHVNGNYIVLQLGALWRMANPNLPRRHHL